MDQDRRDAAAWAKEWYIRKKNRRLLIVIGLLALIVATAYLVNFIIVHTHRTTFGSEEEMRKAMQGRYAIERDYEDIYIEGDDITLTYLAFTHYDRDYAETYGYDYDEEDAVYEDRVVEWDYRNGVIRTEWMGDIIVDKDGNIRRGDMTYDTFFRTDKPRPEPIDPSTLSDPEGDIDADIHPEEIEAEAERAEEIELTGEAAAAAGDGGSGNE